MTISDIASNPLQAGATGPMLGYVEPPAAEAVLALRMYDFLIKPIREQDVTAGQLFLERFLQGPQEVWETIQTDIFRLLDLWDIVRIPDQYLRYLKNIVGWTPELERPITDRLTDESLRRLISVSVVLWKIRGIEDAYTRATLALVLTRMRIWNWFDLRWILDETDLGEGHQGRDPYLLTTVDERTSDIRIVDGTLELDRTLLLNMIKLFRPSGERLNVYWIDFLDLFLVDGDDTQWDGTVDPIPVADRLLVLDDDTTGEYARVDVTDALDWEEYMVYWRVKGTGDAGGTPGEVWGCQFYWQDVDNMYKLEFDIGDNELKLVKRNAGFDGGLITYNFATHGEVLRADVFYGVRVHVETVPTGTRIRVYVDNLERIDHTDVTSPFVRGSIGVYHGTGATVELSEVELYQLPLASNFIDINEAL
jgi:hypothetical protein